MMNKKIKYLTISIFMTEFILVLGSVFMFRMFIINFFGYGALKIYSDNVVFWLASLFPLTICIIFLILVFYLMRYQKKIKRSQVK